MSMDRRYPMILVTAIAVAVGLQSTALAQVGSAAVPAQTVSGAGSPELAAILGAKHVWQSFLKLASKPNAIVTVDDFESAFGQQVLHQGDYYRMQGFVALRLNNDRFARAAYPNRSTNFVSFDFPGSSEAKTCISRSQAISDLKMTGWLVHFHSSGAPPQGDLKEALPPDSPYGSYTLIKGDQGVILLGYSERTSCATTLTMESDKLVFDRVSGTQ